MVNITQKQYSLRKAIATAVLMVSSANTIAAIREKKVPKGDVFEFARAAGLLAIKKTSDVIPDCHPLPVEYSAITYAIHDLSITITVEVHTIYKTGVEVEAMHGAAITALTMYDMLKPIDKAVVIEKIALASKEGGKSGLPEIPGGLRCAVIVCSDSIASGQHKDTAGLAIIERLKRLDLDVAVYEIVKDDAAAIQHKLRALVEANISLALFTGGTGVAPRDNTPEAIRPLLDKEIPGIMETARKYGQERMPFAMLSRGVAGFVDQCLVITLPGSVKGSLETFDAIFPYVLHVFKVRAGSRHE